MSDTTQPPLVKDRRAMLKWLLVGSLALNVLVVGAVIGAITRGGPPGGRGAPQNIIGYVMTLPAERRQNLMLRTAGLRPELRIARQESRSANRDRMAAISADPFDRERFVAAQTRQIEAETKLRMLMRNILADTAAGMTADERRAFLRWRPPFRGGQPAGQDDPDQEPPKKP